MFAEYELVEGPEIGQFFGTGWLPPLPDLRDYTDEHPRIEEIVKELGPAKLRKEMMKGSSATTAAPASIDLRSKCSPIESQGTLGSCTAHAAVGVVEYFERAAFDRHIDGSRLFVYKTTRNLAQVTGDTGAWLRTTMGALVFCGVPPEKYWKYTDQTPAFDKEPPSFVYAVGGNYEAIRYFSHDPLGANVPGSKVLASVKTYLVAKIPSMFGFWGFPSYKFSNNSGEFPYPCPGEKAVWGHAVVAVGYDDGKVIKNTECNKKTTGALLIRNSWGTGWGDKGYGWLPYEYVLNRLALDFWSLLSMKWVETGKFGL